VRLPMVFSLALLLGCGDPNDPGDALPLTPESLEGRWVRIQVVRSTITAPVLSDTTEIESGEIYEFTASGDVTYSCRCPGGAEGVPTPQYTSYSITDDTLWLHQDDGAPQPRLAKVTTRRLVFGGGGPGTTPFDITGDGVPEDVTVADVYQRE
jgi:hypothetical protein